MPDDRPQLDYAKSARPRPDCGSAILAAIVGTAAGFMLAMGVMVAIDLTPDSFRSQAKTICFPYAHTAENLLQGDGPDASAVTEGPVESLKGLQYVAYGAICGAAFGQRATRRALKWIAITHAIAVGMSFASRILFVGT